MINLNKYKITKHQARKIMMGIIVSCRKCKQVFYLDKSVYCENTYNKCPVCENKDVLERVHLKIDDDVAITGMI